MLRSPQPSPHPSRPACPLQTCRALWLLCTSEAELLSRVSFAACDYTGSGTAFNLAQDTHETQQCQAAYLVTLIFSVMLPLFLSCSPSNQYFLVSCTVLRLCHTCIGPSVAFARFHPFHGPSYPPLRHACIASALHPLDCTRPQSRPPSPLSPPLQLLLPLLRPTTPRLAQTTAALAYTIAHPLTPIPSQPCKTASSFARQSTTTPRPSFCSASKEAWCVSSRSHPSSTPRFAPPASALTAPPISSQHSCPTEAMVFLERAVQLGFPNAVYYAALLAHNTASDASDR